MKRRITRNRSVRALLAGSAGLGILVVVTSVFGGTARAVTTRFDPTGTGTFHTQALTTPVSLVSLRVARLEPVRLDPGQAGTNASARMPPDGATSDRGPAQTTGVAARDDLTTCSTDAYHGDTRLGPRRLPVPGLSEVGDEVAGYRRGGSLTTAGLLARYWNASASNGAGSWIYPPDDGYVVDRAGQPIEHVVTLQAGTRLDRYGSEHGGFLSPLGTSYARRAIPPSNLDTADPAYTCNYHAYVVVKAFRLDSGPVAPWFGQPGGGLQDQLDPVLQPDATSVGQLVAAGYLRRLDLH